ncbi:hypothetical protein V8E36_009404 [Tilletia maclaganii]
MASYLKWSPVLRIVLVLLADASPPGRVWESPRISYAVAREGQSDRVDWARSAQDAANGSREVCDGAGSLHALTWPPHSQC